jgi:hypothetical protein
MEMHRCADYSKALFFGVSVANKLENSVRVCTAVVLFVLAPFSSTNGLLPLNQDCVASILNCTVQAEVDGTFELFKVPPSIFGVGGRK